VWHSPILQRTICGGADSTPDAEVGVLSPDAELWCPVQADAGNTNLNREVEDELMDSNDAGSWLQFDAGGSTVIGAFVTQGWHDSWVQTFALSFSQDGIQWTEYRGPDGALQLMRANADAKSDVVVDLSGVTLEARFLRLYPKRWHHRIALRAVVWGCYIGVRIHLPSAPALSSLATSPRVLSTCFAPRRTEGNVIYDFVQLNQSLHICPEPTNPAQMLFVSRGEIFELKFEISGNAMQGEPGDQFVLAPFTPDVPQCAATVGPAMEGVVASRDAGLSTVITLDSGSKVDRQMIMESRLNELDTGEYMVCYATRQSGTDSPNDFFRLTAKIEVFHNHALPTLQLPNTMSLGHELVVQWGNRLSHSNDWIGLYSAADCQQPDLTSDPVNEEQLQMRRSQGEADAQNQCYLATAKVGGGLEEGQVRFAFSDYRVAGKYEVRYFAGDSRDGNGMVCRALRGANTPIEICGLEAKAVSNVVDIQPRFADGSQQHIAERVDNMAEDAKLPGLESFCVGLDCELL
jgi:hypothetical protein